MLKNKYVNELIVITIIVIMLWTIIYLKINRDISVLENDLVIKLTNDGFTKIKITNYNSSFCNKFNLSEEDDNFLYCYEFEAFLGSDYKEGIISGNEIIGWNIRLFNP